MPRPFFERLHDYYAEVAASLAVKASAAAIYPNSTDIGQAREQIYRQFLQSHLPTACNVLLGGFVFNQQGQESRQIDIIVTVDACPQFNLCNHDGHGKSFTCIDGTLAVVCVKSTLEAKELRESLENVASLPQHKTNYASVSMGYVAPDYCDWPYKVVFAGRGMSAESVKEVMTAFYSDQTDIPTNRRPDIIHVAGQYCIRRAPLDLHYEGHLIKAGTYFTTSVESDKAALVLVVHTIQQRLAMSRFISFDYFELFNGMFALSASTQP